MKKFVFLLGMVLILSGCQSMKNVLRQPERDTRLKPPQEVSCKKRHRSPTEILPFKSNDAPPPSMLDSELSDKERAMLRSYQREGDIIAPRDLKESKKKRNWVFGY